MESIRSSVMLILAAMMYSSLAAPSHADEKSFFYLPKGEDARFQEIAKTDNEKGWPFTVDKGLLACIYAAGKPLVMFLVEAGLETDGITPKLRTVTLSPDPFESIFGNMFVNDLIADDGGNTEKRMTLFAPFYALGKNLCRQPKGSQLGSGEL